MDSPPANRSDASTGADGDSAYDLEGLVVDAAQHLRLGRFAEVVDSLAELPSPLLNEQLGLALSLGFAGGLNGDTVLARAVLDELTRIVPEERCSAGVRTALAHLEMSVLAWEGCLVDMKGAVEELAAAIEFDGDDGDQLINGASARSALATGYLGVGRLDEACREAERVLVLDEVFPMSRNAVQAIGVKALALAWAGAERPAREAIRQASSALTRYQGRGAAPLFVHAAACWAGDLDDSSRHLADLDAVNRLLPLPVFNLLTALSKLKLALRLGDHRAASHMTTVVDAELVAMPQPGYLGELAAGLDAELATGLTTELEELKPIEIRMLELLADGASRSEIAHRLNYSVNTVKAHLRHAYRKLGAADREEAVRNARVRGVIGPD